MPWVAGVPRPRELNLAEEAVVEWNRQRTETQRQLAEKYKLENQITRGEVLDRAALMQGLATIVDAVSARIMSSELERSVKEDILKDLASWPIVLQEVIRGQSRLKTKAATRAEASQSEASQSEA